MYFTNMQEGAGEKRWKNVASKTQYDFIRNSVKLADIFEKSCFLSKVKKI